MKFNSNFVHEIASLANLTISEDQANALAQDFDESMSIVDKLTKIETTGIAPTYQVNQLVNVLRLDFVNEQDTLTQEQALANASATHNGYFLVERVIDDAT